MHDPETVQTRGISPKSQQLPSVTEDPIKGSRDLGIACDGSYFAIVPFDSNSETSFPISESYTLRSSSPNQADPNGAA
jgi:hypothetical protein